MARWGPRIAFCVFFVTSRDKACGEEKWQLYMLMSSLHPLFMSLGRRDFRGGGGAKLPCEQPKAAAREAARETLSGQNF